MSVSVCFKPEEEEHRGLLMGGFCGLGLEGVPVTCKLDFIPWPHRTMRVRNVAEACGQEAT